MQSQDTTAIQQISTTHRDDGVPIETWSFVLGSDAEPNRVLLLVVWHGARPEELRVRNSMSGMAEAFILVEHVPGAVRELRAVAEDFDFAVGLNEIVAGMCCPIGRRMPQLDPRDCNPLADLLEVALAWVSSRTV